MAVLVSHAVISAGVRERSVSDRGVTWLGTAALNALPAHRRYLLAFVMPLATLVAAYGARISAVWAFSSPISAFLCVPVMDLLLGRDQTNPTQVILPSNRRGYAASGFSCCCSWSYGVLGVQPVVRLPA